MTENKINSEAVKNYFAKLQTDIINAVEIVDGKNFLVDSWQRSEGGGGTTVSYTHLTLPTTPYV